MKTKIEGQGNMGKQVKLYKHELVLMLADQRIDQYPALYGRNTNGTAEHYGDAVHFVVKHLGPRKSDLVLSAKCQGLIPFDVEVV